MHPARSSGASDKEDTVWVTRGCQMHSLSVSQYQISVWESWSAAMGMVLPGSVRWPDKGRESPGELLHNEERRHIECKAEILPRTTVFESHSNRTFLLSCCPTAGVSTAGVSCPCSKGREHALLSASPPAHIHRKKRAG